MPFTEFVPAVTQAKKVAKEAKLVAERVKKEEDRTQKAALKEEERLQKVHYTREIDKLTTSTTTLALFDHGICGAAHKRMCDGGAGEGQSSEACSEECTAQGPAKHDGTASTRPAVELTLL